MSKEARQYAYIGPPEIKQWAKRESHCILVINISDVIRFTAGFLRNRQTFGSVPATFIIDISEQLWIADRRSEHVACADGWAVLAAGEIIFERDGDQIEVLEITNQSSLLQNPGEVRRKSGPFSDGVFGTSERSGVLQEAQSTGYCPEPACWDTVTKVLSCLGLSHPANFTSKFEFRHCTHCLSTNLIKDDVFECAVCDLPLSRDWNFSSYS